MKLQTLYKTSSKGATQIINMEIIGDTYTRTWGQLNGKQQTKSTTAKGKNIGKANETTPEQQAILEAEAVWTKKQKANYSTSKSAPVTVNLPMKVNKYQDHKSKIKFPCYVSVKLDGVNCEYRLDENTKLSLLSRGGENYPIPPHQEKEIVQLLSYLGTDTINGEMYKHGEHLQDIMAATKKHNALTPSLKFWAFDFPTIEGDYATRCTYAYGRGLDKKFLRNNVQFVNVGTANSHEELDKAHADAVAAGYEGIIIRNGKGLYKYNTKSLDVFKYKEAEDAEFQVSGFTIDKNGHAVFVCDVENTTFKVKMKGTHEERLAIAADAANYIGKWLNVEYETFSKEGKPLKPVGQYFRKVGEDGEAAE